MFVVDVDPDVGEHARDVRRIRVDEMPEQQLGTDCDDLNA